MLAARSEPGSAAAIPGCGRARATKKLSTPIAAAMHAVKPKIADTLTPACCNGPTPNAAIP
jgi:hypothetical protein